MRNAVALWKTVLQQLQQLPTGHQQAGPGGQSDGPLNTLFPIPIVYEFHAIPINSSVWKQLVNDLKVTRYPLMYLCRCFMPTVPKFSPNSMAMAVPAQLTRQLPSAGTCSVAAAVSALQSAQHQHET